MTKHNNGQSKQKEGDKSKQATVAVVGAGLAGTMVAVLLSRLNYKVELYEKRDDPRIAQKEAEDDAEFGRSTNASKRSINLALSKRGQDSLEEIGCLDGVMKDAIRMPGRVIHQLGSDRSSDRIVKQAYGTPDQAIWSVSREGINLRMLNQASDESANVTTFFNHALKSLDNATGHCIFYDEVSKRDVSKHFDLVVGADGAYSAVRDQMLRQGRIDFSRTFIAHGYKELCIPPKIGADGKPTFALDDHEGLHIWPRGEFMLIALPNPDFSFTATLFAPYHGEDGFDSVDASNATAVNAYFNKHFPDVVPLIPDLQAEFKNNPVGSLVSNKVGTWRKGKVLLIGDAAHAVVPFYGQGMNAAFEDCLILYNTLKDLMASRHEDDKLTAELLLAGAEKFATDRKPAGYALADICLEHYHDMAANTASNLYLFRKKMEATLHYLFPKSFVPIYTLVAFTTTPYHHVVEATEKYEKVTNRLTNSLLALGGGVLSFGAFQFWKTYRR
jgi:kynurenine 3-monooxygenase